MKTNEHDVTRKTNLKWGAQRWRSGSFQAFAAVLLFLPLVPGATAFAQCFLCPTNIVAWWPGDGHTYDVINVKPAALQNGASYVAGYVCQAFSFDGSNEKVRIAESTKTDLSRTNKWTIEA